MTTDTTQEDLQIKAISDCYSLLFSTLMKQLLDITGGNRILAHSLALMAAERCKSDAHISYANKLQEIKQEGDA